MLNIGQADNRSTPSIDTEILHSGIVPKPKLWYRAIPNYNQRMHSRSISRVRQDSI